VKKGQTEQSAYQSRDPERRSRQLANLKQNWSAERRAAMQEAQPERQMSMAEFDNQNIIEFCEMWLRVQLYPAQEVILRAFYGLDMIQEQLELFKTIAGGREYVPGTPYSEALLCLGARSGKSFLASIIALYEATRIKWRSYLRKKESGYIVIISPRLDTSRFIIQRNAAQMILNSPLVKLLESEPTANEIHFKNHMRILSIPSTSVAGRGLPIAGLIFDEIGWFPGEGYVKEDEVIYNSLKPRMAQFGADGKTILISTPQAKQGMFWEWFNDGFSVPGRLTAQAPSWVMNPTIEQDFLDKERERDVDNFNREYAAEFCERTETFLSEAIITPAVKLFADTLENSRFKYSMGIDFSGLSGRDKTGVCVSHRLGDVVILDAVRSMDSTSHAEVIGEIMRLAGKYHIGHVYIDKYGAGWTKQALQSKGLTVGIRETLPMLYSNLKRLLITGKIELQEHRDLLSALKSVRAFYGRNNSLSIQHERGPGGHGDLADAVATAAYYSGARVEAEQEPEPEYIFAGIHPKGIIWRRNPNYHGAFPNIKLEKCE